MAKASTANQQIAREVAETFRARPKVSRHWDEQQEHRVDVAHVADSLWSGVTLYSTLGLSDWPLIDQGREHPARVEFMGACESEYEKFGDILASAAFSVIKDQEFAYPGRIFPELVGIYYPEFEMQHLMFVSPFLWEGHPQTQRLPEKTVAWLQPIPISTAELRYARTSGPAALEEMLEQREADVLDLERESVI